MSWLDNLRISHWGATSLGLQAQHFGWPTQAHYWAMWVIALEANSDD